MIAAGLQILPERSLEFLFEKFGAANRQAIYDLIVENEVNNVLFLSGDVHHAAMYETKCLSLSGTKLVEVTSSGLTETIYGNVWDRYYTMGGDWVVENTTPEFWAIGSGYVGNNYGVIIADASGDELVTLA